MNPKKKLSKYPNFVWVDIGTVHIFLLRSKFYGVGPFINYVTQEGWGEGQYSIVYKQEIFVFWVGSGQDLGVLA